MDKTQLLAEYSIFLKKCYLEELSEENRKFLCKINLHPLKLCKDFSIEELYKMSLTNLTELLTAFQEKRITEEEIGKILSLELEALPGVKPEYIESNDLLSIYTAQKQAVICFIPKFTNDTEIMLALTQEIEITFLKALDITLEAFVNQRISSVKNLTESKVREETTNYYNQELKAANLELQTQNKILEKVQEELKISYGVLKDQNENHTILQNTLINRQETLVEKEIELTRSNQYLDQFASMASHDLKEPLRMVKQYVRLVEKRLNENMSPDIKEFIDYAVDGVERMDHLIISLLNYSKLNKLGLPTEPMSMETSLEKAKMNLIIAIDESKAEITNDELPMVKVNMVQLIRIFQNLLSNALKYRSPETPAKIHIGAEKKENNWLLYVKDNGIGIKQENFEKIFQPFQRLHTSSEYEGVGLGLSFCKKIIENYGGNMWVESELNKGSTFFFTILGA